jgi:hypothetical protein
MRALVIGIVICGLASAAHADKAEQLFKKGKKLLAEQRYAEACRAFEQSDRLDPGIGAKLNVARCYEEWGKLATAWRWYTEAEQMANDAADARAKKIHVLIAELDPTVPRLTLSLPDDAITDHVVIKLDGVELPLAALTDERRVDPGPHQIDTIVDGVKRTKVIPIERGSKAELSLDVPVRTKPVRKPVPPTETEESNRTRRRIGLGISGAGVVALGIAGIVTLRARGDYQHALDAHCSGDPDMCDDIGQTDTHSARSRANIATGVTLFGLAAVAGGLILYFTTPKDVRTEHALYLGPAMGGGGGGDGKGVVLGGVF